MKWNVPNSQECPGKFSISESLSEPGWHLFWLCLGFRDQIRDQKSSRTAGQCLSPATEATSESDEGHLEFCGYHLLPISHEATGGGGGWAWKLVNLSCGILLSFWIEKIGTIYWASSMSVVPDWGWTCSRGHLARSGGLWVVATCDWCYWYLVGRGHRCY